MNYLITNDCKNHPFIFPNYKYFHLNNNEIKHNIIIIKKRAHVHKDIQ